MQTQNWPDLVRPSTKSARSKKPGNKTAAAAVVSSGRIPEDLLKEIMVAQLPVSTPDDRASSNKIVTFHALPGYKEQSAEQELAAFEAMMLPHLDAAKNLARWLLKNDRDAEDVVQEAYLRHSNPSTDFTAPMDASGC